MTTQINPSYLVLDEPAFQDVTDKLESLVDLAQAEGKGIWVATKDMVISRTVMISVNISGPGSGMAGFITRVSDGSPTLYVHDGGHLRLEGFSITGEQTLQNTSGLKLGDPSIYDPANNSVNRSFMQDVLVTKCAVGLEWQGWINTLDHVLVTWCGVGAKLSRQNSSNLGLMFEANTQDFQMKDCWGVHWPVLLMEGNRDLHQVASTMDNVRGLTIGVIYTEHAGEGIESTPWVHFGPDHTCSNIKIHNAVLGPNEVESLLIDLVKGLDADIWNWGSGSAQSYRVTSRATGININVSSN